MKKLILSLFLIIAITPLSAQTTPSPNTLTLNIKNIKKIKGNLRVTLMNSKENYEGVMKSKEKKTPKSKPFKHLVVPVTDKEMSITFEGVPTGEYGFVVIHDENGNQRFDIGIFGPKEPYIFSNQQKGSFGPAKYEKARFFKSPTLNMVEARL